MSKVIEYTEEEKQCFDTYVENLTDFYQSMKEISLITDFEVAVDRDTFDIKTSLWLNLPTRKVVVTVRDLSEEETINLLEAASL